MLLEGNYRQYIDARLRSDGQTGRPRVQGRDVIVGPGWSGARDNKFEFLFCLFYEVQSISACWKDFSLFGISMSCGKHPSFFFLLRLSVNVPSCGGVGPSPHYSQLSFF